MARPYSDTANPFGRRYSEHPEEDKPMSWPREFPYEIQKRFDGEWKRMGFTANLNTPLATSLGGEVRAIDRSGAVRARWEDGVKIL